MNSAVKKLNPVWLAAFLLYFLRWMERKNGFDPLTALSVPTLFRTLVVVGVFLTAAVVLYRCRTLSAERVAFCDHFAAPAGRALPVLVLSSFLLMGGGLWLIAQFIIENAGISSLATAVLALAAGGGFLLLAKQMRSGTAGNVMPFLPVLFFSALWLLSLYLPAGDDPVLARYWLPLLAAATDACAFSQLAGFCRKETKIRTFGVTARLAIIFSCAASAMVENACVLLLLGCAGILGVFLALERE